MMVGESQRAFKAQKFGGKKWEPRGKVNVYGILADFAMGRKEPPKRRFQDRPALRDTGRLSASIAFKLPNRFAVEVGTNLDYAAVHQEGGITKSAKITPDVRKALWAWLKKKRDKNLRKQLGWLLNKKFINKQLEGRVPKRPFVGITKETIKDVAEIVGVYIAEADQA